MAGAIGHSAGQDAPDSLQGALLRECGALAALLDCGLETLSCTPALRAALGLDDDHRLFASLPPDWREACVQALIGASSDLQRTTIGPSDGAARMMRAAIRPLRNSARSGIVGVSIALFDETDIAELGREMQMAKETLRVASRTANFGIWRLDLDARSVWMSPEYERIMGMRLSFEDLASRAPGWLYAEDVPRYAEFLRDLTGEKGRASIEHRLAHAPESWLHATCERILDPVTGARSYVGTARNITARKLAELELMDATRRAHRSLCEKRAMLNDILSDLGLSRAAATEPAVEPIPQHATGISDLTAQFLAIIAELDARDCVIADSVQALRASRFAAQQASAAKSQFLRAMTHELRTPLNAIIGYSEILIEDAIGRHDAAAAADQHRILAAGCSLKDMLETILDFTTLESGEIALAEEQYCPAEVAREIAGAMRAQASQNGNSLEIELAELGQAVGDSARLRQCLRQLLSNACKFTSNGEIVLRAAREADAGGDNLKFDVIDTGIGIAAADQDRLFEPFVLCDASKARKQSGAGLGLALTRGLAQLMGGDVEASSELGRGSTFTLKIASTPVRRRTGAFSQALARTQ